FISNDLGEYAILKNPDFQAFVEGDLSTESALFRELTEKGFVAGEISNEEYRNRYWDKRAALHQGPVLHGFVLTERCNHGCQYCHSSVVGMDRTDTDMSIEVAEKSVDFALQTTSPGLTIEFQGGEPTINWDVLVHTVKYAQVQNKTARKNLALSLVTNLSLMTDERLDFLVSNHVQICTSLDGPRTLHNKVRIFKGGDSHENVTHWLKRINDRYVEMGLDPTLYRAEALPTITKYALPQWKEIVDSYVELGCRALFLRVLDPFGFAAITNKTLGYSMEEFLDFYCKAVDYIIELNKQGVQIMERLAAIMLSKMIGGDDPNYLDLRSPGGAAIGQLAYHPNGNIYSSDEGRMIAAMGDEFFLLGNVNDLTYRELMQSPQTRALVLASTNEALPGCASCAYKPYCGQQPEYNYITQDSIQGRMPESTWCQKHMGIFDYLAKRLDKADAEEMQIFQRWIVNRSQDHFLQTDA
ncbi:MAG TPA: His-Xaa-Ser system radical SAM maturase HxsB, partial [Myxococcales bacterium]|nr:His-Xaa-Ser system radical SAM maturase HxsB [Myxococcales bacterium]